MRASVLSVESRHLTNGQSGRMCRAPALNLRKNQVRGRVVCGFDGTSRSFLWLLRLNHGNKAVLAKRLNEGVSHVSAIGCGRTLTWSASFCSNRCRAWHCRLLCSCFHFCRRARPGWRDRAIYRTAIRPLGNLRHDRDATFPGRYPT